MDYLAQIYLLSSKFIQDYPSCDYPELMYKQGRPYACLLIDTHDGYFICVPFRSSISHKNAFLFRNTERSKQTKSGLDYSKIVIIEDMDYIDSIKAPIIDHDEYREMMSNLTEIVEEVHSYVNSYIQHVKGDVTLHPKQFERKYGYTTLVYFHSILGIS